MKGEDNMTGLWLSIGVGALAVLLVVTVSIKEILHVQSQEYLCVNCGKKFSPRFSFMHLVNLGDDSKIVKCPHCAHKERMVPVSEKN